MDSKVYRFSVLTINLQSQNVKIKSTRILSESLKRLKKYGHDDLGRGDSVEEKCFLASGEFFAATFESGGRKTGFCGLGGRCVATPHLVRPGGQTARAVCRSINHYAESTASRTGRPALRLGTH